MKKTVTKKKTTKKAVKKKATTKTKTTKKPVKKQATKKPIKKAKTTKKSSSKVTKKPIRKVSKKTVKKVTKKTARKPKTIPVEKVRVEYDSIESDSYQYLFSKDEPRKRSYKTPVIVCIVLCILFVICGFILYKNDLKPQINIIDIIDEVITDDYIDSKYKDIWNEYHDNSYVPNDYIGQIVFESEIINEPVMQGETNDTYLNRNYQTYKYEVCGPVFMDFACKKDDQNLVLYGHTRSKSVDPNRVMMFTPLHVLEDKENYEDNKIVYFVYEDFVDVYQVCYVYNLQTVTDENGLQYLKEGEPLYYLNSYSDSEFKEYVKTIEKRQLYDTGVRITSDDKLLTLQTCLEGSTDKFIVVAKKIETRQYR